jgi:tetratricopeptide (TPR) repeat protein
LGLVYFELKMYENSINIWQKLLTINPKDAYVRYHLGCAFEEVGLILKAKDEWEKAISLAEAGSSIMSFARESLDRVHSLEEI